LIDRKKKRENTNKKMWRRRKERKKGRKEEESGGPQDIKDSGHPQDIKRNRIEKMQMQSARLFSTLSHLLPPALHSTPLHIHNFNP